MWVGILSNSHRLMINLCFLFLPHHYAAILGLVVFQGEWLFLVSTLLFYSFLSCLLHHRWFVELYDDLFAQSHKDDGQDYKADHIDMLSDVILDNAWICLSSSFNKKNFSLFEGECIVGAIDKKMLLAETIGFWEWFLVRQDPLPVKFVYLLFQ